MTTPQYQCNDFSDIAKCFEQLHLHINTEVATLKAKQADMEKRIDMAENHIEFINSEIHDIHNKHVPNIEDKIEKESIERLKLELWGRKWNLVIRGLKGGDRENPRKTITVVKVFLHTRLGFKPEDVNKMLFAAVHRLPSGPVDQRNVIIRLSSLLDRDEILSAATKLQRGSGYSVVPDLPPSLATLRGNLLKERSEMSEDDRKKCRLVYLKDAPFLKLVMKDS